VPVSQQRIPFHFHAEGHAFSGEFRHPTWSIIPAQAATSLPTIGGHAESTVENFRFLDYVQFKHAHTHISGKRRVGDSGDSYVTHASAVIEGLNILGTVTADRIVSRLTSVHKVGDPEPHIVAEDSRFEGLRIAGQDVKVTLRHKLLVENRTAADVIGKGIASDKKNGRMVGIDPKGRVAICSLVEKIETKLPGVDAKKHLIEVKNFGRIYLAELFVEESTRTLTMLRLELGSPHVATITAAETRSNGQPVPPSGPEVCRGSLLDCCWLLAVRRAGRARPH